MNTDIIGLPVASVRPASPLTQALGDDLEVRAVCEALREEEAGKQEGGGGALRPLRERST